MQKWRGGPLIDRAGLGAWGRPHSQGIQKKGGREQPVRGPEQDAQHNLNTARQWCGGKAEEQWGHTDGQWAGAFRQRGGETSARFPPRRNAF